MRSPGGLMWNGKDKSYHHYPCRQTVPRQSVWWQTTKNPPWPTGSQNGPRSTQDGPGVLQQTRTRPDSTAKRRLPRRPRARDGPRRLRDGPAGTTDTRTFPAGGNRGDLAHVSPFATASIVAHLAAQACRRGRSRRRRRRRRRRPASSSRYTAGISACGNGGQWQRALALLGEMQEAKVEPNVISYNAGISGCEKGGQWQRTLALMSEMWEAKVKPDIISPIIYSTGISACEKQAQWQRALALLSEVREAKVEPD
ncbi:unnamed protein product [Prorocentrum cordatum]|uniref:Pentatricopeptide repeat-containing protein n=1 Tax=Prorocentrum cordatum TaxID=2364126 RepID=A0ABN9UV50_9DINO|nr:unnamed protein product [Polarella glacialis]